VGRVADSGAVAGSQRGSDTESEFHYSGMETWKPGNLENWKSEILNRGARLAIQNQNSRFSVFKYINMENWKTEILPSPAKQSGERFRISDSQISTEPFMKI